LFLAVSPIGVHRLASILNTEPRYKPYSSITTFIGYGTFVLSIVWFLFFVLGVGLPYRGIFQKIIAVPVLCWLLIMGFASIKRRKA
jgi:ABC-type transport system involved in cytochrome c biogenesis permease component